MMFQTVEPGSVFEYWNENPDAFIKWIVSLIRDELPGTAVYGDLAIVDGSMWVYLDGEWMREMHSDEALQLGTRVRTKVAWASVPKGTEGVIDEIYARGVVVAWDLPDSPLPPGYERYEGEPAIKTGILRDGFTWSELEHLEPVNGGIQ